MKPNTVCTETELALIEVFSIEETKGYLNPLFKLHYVF